VTHDGAGGHVTVVLTAAQTELLPAPGGIGKRWAELWVTDLEGRRDLVAAGPCFVYDTLIYVDADAGSP
jgi:hypothetical protein